MHEVELWHGLACPQCFLEGLSGTEQFYYKWMECIITAVLLKLVMLQKFGWARWFTSSKKASYTGAVKYNLFNWSLTWSVGTGEELPVAPGKKGLSSCKGNPDYIWEIVLCWKLMCTTEKQFPKDPVPQCNNNHFVFCRWYALCKGDQ